MARLLTFPGRPPAANVAQGPLADQALRGWASRQLVREHLARGELTDASGALARAAAEAGRAPRRLRQSLNRDLDRLAVEIGRMAARAARHEPEDAA